MTTINSTRKLSTLFAEKPYLMAMIISLILVLWMASGMTNEQPETAQHAAKSAPVAKVQVKAFHAQKVHQTIHLYGRTAADRTSDVRAEQGGLVTKIFVERGQKVQKGQVIALLDPQDLPAQLASAKALLKQREIAFKGAEKLKQQGYQGEAQYAQAAADLAGAKARVAQLTIALEQTQIVAPFTGILNERFIELGDYVKTGDKVAQVVDLNPIVVTAYATEKQVGELAVQQPADVKLITGEHVQGNVRYIARVADNNTNTFKVEVAVDNASEKQVAGMSSEVVLSFDEKSAIKLSPALLSLDEQGNIGVKTVNNNRVEFTPIHIVKSESDGLWLSGLGESPLVITLGQGFVRAGDNVETVMVGE
jgi:multidrug efflux system membrane fusion protein